MMRPGTAVLLEVAERLPDAGEGAAQVHVDDRVEVVVGHLQQGLVPQDAGVGDQDVQPAEFRRRPPAPAALATSELPTGATTATARPPSDSMVRTASAATAGVHVVDDDGGALPGQFPGVGQAEAAAASGDDCYFSCQAHGCSFASCRVHPCRAAWDAVLHP